MTRRGNASGRTRKREIKTSSGGVGSKAQRRRSTLEALDDVGIRKQRKMKELIDVLINVVKDVFTSNWSIGVKLTVILLIVALLALVVFVVVWDRAQGRLVALKIERIREESQEKIKEREAQLALDKEELRARLEREEKERVKREQDAAWAREWESGVKRRLNDLTPLAKDILLEMEKTKYPLILDNITANSFTVDTKVYIGKESRYENEEKMDISTAIQTLIDGALVFVDAASSPYPGITNRTVYRLTKSGAQLARDARELGKIQK